MFRLMPRADAILDCSPVSAAGHCIPQIYQPITACQFMAELRAEEHIVSHHSEAPSVSIHLKLHKFQHAHVILQCIHLQRFMK
jgi:hypothetical protein